ncbi:MAG: hypothetical protein QM773_16035 [Hyphomonadaceae bacterium]
MRKKDWIACLIYCAIMVTPYLGQWAIYVLGFLVMPLTLLVANPLASFFGGDATMALAILTGVLILAGPARALTVVAIRTPAEKRLLRLFETLAIWTLVSFATLYAFYVGQAMSRT